MKILNFFVLIILFTICLSQKTHGQKVFYVEFEEGYDHDRVILTFKGTQILDDTLTSNGINHFVKKIELSYTKNDLENAEGVGIYINNKSGIFFPLSMIPDVKRLITVNYSHGNISLNAVRVDYLKRFYKKHKK